MEEILKEPNNDHVCGICLQSKGKYTCPKCGALYCSLICYQSAAHQECTEKFYKECVVEEIVLRKKEDDSQSQQKIIEALKKLKEQEEQDDIYDDELDSDDTDAEEDLAKRLAGVDLDNPDAVWAKLSDQEKQEFEQLLKSGEIHNLVEPWEPWWLSKQPVAMVEEIGSPAPTKEAIRIPPIKKNIAELSTLTTKPPSADVGNNLCNVLYAYTVTARLYNGDHLDNSLPAAELIMKLSSNLRCNQSFSTSSDAVDAGFLETVQHPDLQLPAELTKKAKRDISHIIKGPSPSKITAHSLAALSDLHALFTKALTQLDPKNNREERKRLLLTVKKFDYYLSWLKSLHPAPH